MCHLPRSASALFVALLTGCQMMGGGSGSGPNTASSGSAGAAPSNVGGDGKAAVTELLEQYRKALQAKDVATADRIWADDLSFINYRGQLLTKAQRLENLRTGATAFKSIKIHDQVVRAYGDAVVVNSVSEIEGQYSGQEGSGTYRVTTVWSRQSGQWKMVAIQMTKVEK